MYSREIKQLDDNQKDYFLKLIKQINKKAKKVIKNEYAHGFDWQELEERILSLKDQLQIIVNES